MSDDLLVRVYNIGCGDCIFLRIPDGDRLRHILIDCGNFFGDRVTDLRGAIANVVELLNDPEIPETERRRLDLLVATHQHWDHLKGFEGALETLKAITIERIWITIAMQEDYAGAQGLHALQTFVEQTVQSLVEDRGMTLNPVLHSTLLLSLSTAEATQAVRKLLPEHHSIEPLFVYRGVENELTPENQEAQLMQFDDPSIKLHILAPEREIDDAYMSPTNSLLEELEAGQTNFLSAVPEEQRQSEPTNISRGAFRLLKSQLFHTSLLAASLENGVINNTSVSLLLEWRGRRLLFPGDAEHESWQIMWANARLALSDSLNFLKISHHGSHNGTPYRLDDPENPINEILDTLLPKENAENAKAVVTTLAGRIHAPIHPVPFPELMNELASRVSNNVEYSTEFGRQPQRTDLEPGEWVDVWLTPATTNDQ